MAIALNTASTYVTSTNARRAYRARVVPAASVWDADVYDARRAGVAATPQLTERIFFAAPAPIMAVIFV